MVCGLLLQFSCCVYYLHLAWQLSRRCYLHWIVRVTKDDNKTIICSNCRSYQSYHETLVISVTYKSLEWKDNLQIVVLCPSHMLNWIIWYFVLSSIKISIYHLCLMSVSVSASVEQSADNIYTEIWTLFLICWCWCCQNMSDHN